MIRHIVAIERHGGIADHGRIPWNLPTDKRYYREIVRTHGGKVLMGSSTYSHPLPGCELYVASRNPSFTPEGATVVRDIEAFLDAQPDVWIAGGAEIYKQTLARADELYITQVDAEFDCDRFYPAFSHDFVLIEQGSVQHENGLGFRFNLYKPAKRVKRL
jgi:dihydrofolate reductase